MVRLKVKQGNKYDNVRCISIPICAIKGKFSGYDLNLCSDFNTNYGAIKGKVKELRFLSDLYFNTNMVRLKEKFF